MEEIIPFPGKIFLKENYFDIRNSKTENISVNKDLQFCAKFKFKNAI